MGDEETRAQRVRSGLLPIEGPAWDIAWPTVFFASDESRWITGTELPIDAGTASSAPLALDLLRGRRRD